MAFEPTQKQLILGVVLSTLTTTSYFFAEGSTELVASAVLDTPSAENGSRSVRVPVSSAVRDRTPLGQAILTRNIFDSQTGSIPWDEPPPAVAVVDDDGETSLEEEEIDPNAPPPPCEGSVRLVASYLRPNRPEQSFAAITNATGTSLLYAQGMRVDDREVVQIGRSRVVLRPQGGSLCSLSMFAEMPAVATARHVPAIAAPVMMTEPSAGDGTDTAELDANIQQISDTSYAVNRSLVDRLLSNQAELMRSARVIPHEVDGRTVGVKIYGIRRSSLLGRLGIQNGDMLRTINGFDLTEPDSVLEAYTRLRSADRLSLSIERRGAPVNMDYQIR